MARRKRKHIPIIELLASALADNLPPAVRDDLRARKVPARQVVKMFSPDHIKLHAWGGKDRWFDLDMRLRDASLKAKNAADTSRAAKAVRVSEKHEKFRKRLLKPGPRKRRKKSRWGYRPLKGRNGFERRAQA